MKFCIIYNHSQFVKLLPEHMFYNSDDLWLGLSALKICILYFKWKRIDDIWHWNILHTHDNSGFLFSLQTSFPFLPVNSKSKDAKSPQVAWWCGARCGSSTASHWRPHLAEPFSTGKEQPAQFYERSFYYKGQIYKGSLFISFQIVSLDTSKTY